MGKKQKYYAVACGTSSRIYDTWEQCEYFVKGRRGCRFKSFACIQDAELFAYGEVRTPYPEEEKHVLDDDTIEIWTDGATSHNGSSNKGMIRAGIGVWFGKDHPWNLSEPFLLENPTNQRAEIWAIVRAMDQLDVEDVPLETPIVLYTDSKYCQQCYMSWIPNWKKASVDWKTKSGTPVKNKELLVQMYDLLKRRKVIIKHVSGHSGNRGNDAADKLAVAACIYGGASSSSDRLK